MILLISTLGVKSAHASQKNLDLTLDTGFMGRPVSLELFGSAIRLSWDATALLKPTKIVLMQSDDGSFGFFAEDASAFASGSKMSVLIKSDISKDPAFRIDANGSTTSIPALSEGQGLMAEVAIASRMSILAVSDAEVQPKTVANESSSLVLTDKSVELTLDSGFVDRPVSLDLFGGELTVSWDKKTLLKPTKLTVTMAIGGVWRDQNAAANAVNIRFEDPSAISAAGVMNIRHRALRPPTATERPDVNILAASTSTRKAVFSGTRISYTVPASSDSGFAPVYCSGIMRTGTASWYRYKNCLCAASPDVPKGTKLKVSRQDDPSVSVIVTVNDYGPDRSIHPERVIDLDRVAFSKIGNPRGGVLDVTVEKAE